eukprot:TRINITY_DN104889_c0_g1_i2.p1 TRINITY_DN104889_c0_g1~~TRINITY_DN104889_c0_g1_i2.p1  ORF type:complete len:203 (-),score=24.84 TRINITY_DN104889_c0_g1_i2:65-673(-)
MGRVAGEGDAPWIKVRGNRNGPIVTLKDNDYSGINDQEWTHPTQIGKVYQFVVASAERDPGTIGFSITREAQTAKGQPQQWGDWEADQHLATVVYVGNDDEIDFRTLIFAIGVASRQTYIVGVLCCYTVKMIGHPPVRELVENGLSVAECLMKKTEDHMVEVTATKKCSVEKKDPSNLGSEDPIDNDLEGKTFHQNGRRLLR